MNIYVVGFFSAAAADDDDDDDETSLSIPLYFLQVVLIIAHIIFSNHVCAICLFCYV